MMLDRGEELRVSNDRLTNPVIKLASKNIANWFLLTLLKSFGWI